MTNILSKSYKLEAVERYQLQAGARNMSYKLDVWNKSLLKGDLDSTRIFN